MRVECRVRALECELRKLRLVRSSGDIVYLHAVGKDCFSRSSNKSKRRARGCVQRPQHFLDALLFLLRSVVTGISPCSTNHNS